MVFVENCWINSAKKQLSEHLCNSVNLKNPLLDLYSLGDQFLKSELEKIHSVLSCLSLALAVWLSVGQHSLVTFFTIEECEVKLTL